MTESKASTTIVSVGLLAIALAVIVAFSNDSFPPPAAAQKSEPFPLISVFADTPPVVAVQDQPRIDVKALEETLSTLRKDNPEEWLKAFEKRVNEIYEGDEVVSVRAENVDGGLQITGLVEDKTLFSFLQKKPDAAAQGTAAGTTPTTLTVYTNSNQPVHHESHLVQNLIMFWMLHNMMTPSYRYQTPAANITSIREQRTVYRSTPAFQVQRESNKVNLSKPVNLAKPDTGSKPLNLAKPADTSKPAAAPAATRPVTTNSAPAAAPRTNYTAPTSSFRAPASSGSFGRR